MLIKKSSSTSIWLIIIMFISLIFSKKINFLVKLPQNVNTTKFLKTSKITPTIIIWYSIQQFRQEKNVTFRTRNAWGIFYNQKSCFIFIVRITKCILLISLYISLLTQITLLFNMVIYMKHFKREMLDYSEFITTVH